MLDRDLLQATSDLENNLLEQDTQETNRAFHLLLGQSAQITWLLNPAGVILEANQTALGFGKVNYEQVVGRPLAAAMGWTFSERGQGRLRAAIRSAAEGETVCYEADIQGAESESVFDLTVRLIEQAKQPPMLMVEGVDVSDRKRLETYLHRCQHLENIGELTAGIAYDLDDLLSPALAVSSLLQLEFPEAANYQRRLVRIFATRTNRAISLAKQILRFAKGDTEKYQLLQVDRLLLSVNQLVRLALPASVMMDTHIPVGDWQILGNENQLHQLLMNLCLNARDAMPDGGHLELSIEHVEVVKRAADAVKLEDSPTSYIVIRVSDTGYGIPPEVFDRLFEPFFTTKAANQGSGLGLPTAMTIVESHGGFIDVISSAETGSQFLVFLPAIAA